MGTIDGPIAPAQPALNFDELAQLRDLTRVIGRAAVGSLKGYRDDVTGGYFHVLNRDAKKPEGTQPGDPSKASSATVAPFLIRSGRWEDSLDGKDSKTAAQRLLKHIVRNAPWTSAGLPDDNPFTVAFLLELVATLCDAGATLTKRQRSICREKLAVLLSGLREGKGRISIAGEVPNSYLTDLVSRVLVDWTSRRLVEDGPLTSPEIEDWIWQEAINSVNAQLALLGGDRSSADVFELGYAVLLALQFPGERLRPEHRTLLRRALAAFFEAQAPDGSWPRSRRLFRYPTYGDAYCYEFEFLARLLRAFSTPGEDSNRKALLPFLAHLQRSITRLSDEAVALPHGGYGWASGHHRSFIYPESWSTASCFDVCDLTDRLVTDTVTTTVLRHLEQPRLATDLPASGADFAKVLDSRINLPGGHPWSLKDVLRLRLLNPIADQAKRIEEGKELAEGTALSAILYGPPGTSKTTYAGAISRFLGWNLITIDPSHLLRSGIDNIHLEINTLFRMLEYAERVVVFFDEIDELVRDRSEESGEAVSRFLTTSMLPRIVKLRKSRKMVYLVATNHIENFDAAFARPGRFDLVLPVLPPTAAQKLVHWPELAKTMTSFGLNRSRKQRDQIEHLTYDELRSIEGELVGAANRSAFIGVLSEAAETGILNQKVIVNQERTWRELMQVEARRIRV